jgi:PAS domain S-box-containing protein
VTVPSQVPLWLFVGVLGAGGVVAAWWARRRARSDEARLRQLASSLARSAERLEEVECIASVGSWRLDFSSGELEWSTQLFELFGVQPHSPVELEQMLAMLHPDDVGRVRQQLDALHADGADMELVCRLRRPDGQERVLRACGNVVERAAGGAVRVVVGTAQDITMHHHAEQRMRDSERRYRLLFQHNPLPLWTYDTHSLQITDANLAAVEKYGFTRRQLLQCRVPDLHPREERQALVAMLKARSGRPGPGDRRWHHVSAGGELFAVDIYGQDAPFHGSHCRLVCLIDRSAEQRATEALQRLNSELESTVAERNEVLARREEHYRVLSDLSPQIIWQADDSGCVTYLNRAWYEMVGQRPEGWLGYRWLDALHPDDVGPTRAAFDAALTGSTTMRAKRRVLDRRGSYRSLMSVGAPVLRPDGSVAGWIGVDSDITELERQAERLAQLNDELESFSYSVSHDLRAPVQVMKGFLEAVLAGQGGAIADAARGYLERVLRNARRMDELISDMLTLARLSREPLRLQRFDVAALVRELVEGIQERHPDQVVECRVPARAELVADRRLMKALLENLMDNGAKFSRGRPACRMEFTVRQELAQVVLELADEGVGFPSEQAHRLFRPFQRLHAQRTFTGTGIGLATVARIAQLHGGSVAGRNRPGGGACFEVRLPLLCEAAVPAGRPVP